MEFKHLFRVSILGPVSTCSAGEETEQFLNVRRMLDVADHIVAMGLVPHVPGLCAIWHMVHALPRETWIAISQNEIVRSDVCLRMAGPSRGADAEIEFAEQIGKRVVYSLEELGDWARGQGVDVPHLGTLKERRSMLRDYHRQAG